jgi:hypothetical protein
MTMLARLESNHVVQPVSLHHVPLVRIIVAFGVQIVLHDKVLLGGSGEGAGAIDRSLCRTADRGLFRYGIAGIDPVRVDIHGRREVCTMSAKSRRSLAHTTYS